MDFTVPANHRVKVKESEKKDKYQDFAKELKKLWNMKVTIKPTLIDTMAEGLGSNLVNWRQSKLQYYWDRSEHWEESWRLEETCCHSKSSERPPANVAQKDLMRLVGEGDPLGFEQEIEIWPYYQITYVQTRNCPGEWNAKEFSGICRQKLIT